MKTISPQPQKPTPIITDLKHQHELIKNNSTPKLSYIYPYTCTNKQQRVVSPSPSQSCKKIETCKNGHFGGNQRSRSKSINKSMSKSKNKQQSCEDFQQRKKQTDYFCLQRVMNMTKKYVAEQESKYKWNLQQLNYQQFIQILWVCRYVPYLKQQQYVQMQQQQELKKIFCLWISLSTKKTIKMKDIVSVIQALDNLQVEEQKIETLLNNLQNQLDKITSEFVAANSEPTYTFFIKRLDIGRKDKNIVMNEILREKIQANFNSFKLNKLKDSGVFQHVKIQQQAHVFISKKSSELADQKRKKLQQKIKMKKPHIQNINLIQLLSYRQRDHIPITTKKTETRKNVFVKPKKIENKKQIQLLSQPKMYFEERRQDEVNFHRNQQQFTFHPKINPCKNDPKQKILSIKNVDKMLVRMKEARQKNQQRKGMMNKGWSNAKRAERYQQKYYQNQSNKQNILEHDLQNFQQHQYFNKTQTLKQFLNQNKQSNQVTQNPSQSLPIEKVQRYQISKQNLKIPILYIDVNIQQGKKQRIIIYDSDRAELLAKQFGKKHKLNPQTISRLQLLLQQQMDTVLARIDQQSQDECSILY